MVAPKSEPRKLLPQRLTSFCMVSFSGCILTGKSSGTDGGIGFSPGAVNSQGEPTDGPGSGVMVVLLAVSTTHCLLASGPSHVSGVAVSLPEASATTAKKPPLPGWSPGLTFMQS